MHWINVVAVTILLMSGLQIFNAHPTLNWGHSSYSGRPALLMIGAEQLPDGHTAGVTHVFGHKFRTTGVLGVSGPRDAPEERAFPSWATIPGPQWLAMATEVASVLRVGSRPQWDRVRGVFDFRPPPRPRPAPTRTELRSVGQSIRDHLRFTHPSGEAARALQRVAENHLLGRDLRPFAADHPTAVGRCRRDSIRRFRPGSMYWAEGNPRAPFILSAALALVRLCWFTCSRSSSAVCGTICARW